MDPSSMRLILLFLIETTQNVDLPNLYPFKKSVIENLERKKKEKELEKLQNKEKHMDIDFETA